MAKRKGRRSPEAKRRQNAKRRARKLGAALQSFPDPHDAEARAYAMLGVFRKIKPEQHWYVGKGIIALVALSYQTGIEPRQLALETAQAWAQDEVGTVSGRANCS